MNSPTDKMGFPEGVAEKLVLQSFHKYDSMAKKRLQAKKKTESDFDHTSKSGRNAIENSSSAKSTDNIPPSGMQSSDKNQKERSQCIEECSSAKAEISAPMLSAEIPSENKSKKKETKIRDEQMDLTSSAQGDKSAVSVEDQTKFQDNPDSYNGAIREKYSWSQSITDVDVKIWVPDYVRKGKEVQVTIQRKHLCVKYRNPAGDMCIQVDGDLMWDVHKDECMWSLEPGKCVLVNLGKVQERWWEAVLTDEPKINVQKIDPSRPITDLDDEAQAKIEEMMYNERQKKLGLPQSHEQKVHSMLKTAWDAEGSPFRGQPFDPSKINISSNMT